MIDIKIIATDPESKEEHYIGFAIKEAWNDTLSKVILCHLIKAANAAILEYQEKCK